MALCDHRLLSTVVGIVCSSENGSNIYIDQRLNEVVHIRWYRFKNAYHNGKRKCPSIFLHHSFPEKMLISPDRRINCHYMDFILEIDDGLWLDWIYSKCVCVRWGNAIINLNLILGGMNMYHTIIWPIYTHFVYIIIVIMMMIVYMFVLSWAKHYHIPFDAMQILFCTCFLAFYVRMDMDICTTHIYTLSLCMFVCVRCEAAFDVCTLCVSVFGMSCGICSDRSSSRTHEQAHRMLYAYWSPFARFAAHSYFLSSSLILYLPLSLSLSIYTRNRE